MSHTEFQSSIDACNECASECMRCKDACITGNEMKDLTQCIKLTSECASVCILASRMMAEGSEFRNQINELCASVCEVCARECKNHSQLEYCSNCAEACLKCSEECRSSVKVSELEIP